MSASPMARPDSANTQSNSARHRPQGATLAHTLVRYQPPAHPPKRAQHVPITIISDPSDCGTVSCDAYGHYIVVPGNDLTDRYGNIKLVGQGTFSQVVQATEKTSGKLVAIKIGRSLAEYYKAGRAELRILETLRANDEDNRNRCIYVRDCFDYRGHICIVTDLFGQSVFDFLKSNKFMPFPGSQIQSFAHQLFMSVACLISGSFGYPGYIQRAFFSS
ncbi:serine threonine protein kinase CMGC group [Madurella fahalii]|uniref:Serine threonine protein kinase CMGC group n=1 Tax=Madurella fahalii TaxID=1157608 RepID=A0ABQ0G460_9PEZI